MKKEIFRKKKILTADACASYIHCINLYCHWPMHGDQNARMSHIDMPTCRFNVICMLLYFSNCNINATEIFLNRNKDGLCKLNMRAFAVMGCRPISADLAIRRAVANLLKFATQCVRLGVNDRRIYYLEYIINF